VAKLIDENKLAAAEPAGKVPGAADRNSDAPADQVADGARTDSVGAIQASRCGELMLIIAQKSQAASGPEGWTPGRGWARSCG
jgi:hypothetical protein